MLYEGPAGGKFSGETRLELARGRRGAGACIEELERVGAGMMQIDKASRQADGGKWGRRGEKYRLDIQRRQKSRTGIDCVGG